MGKMMLPCKSCVHDHDVLIQSSIFLALLLLLYDRDVSDLAGFMEGQPPVFIDPTQALTGKPFFLSHMPQFAVEGSVLSEYVRKQM